MFGSRCLWRARVDKELTLCEICENVVGMLPSVLNYITALQVKAKESKVTPLAQSGIPPRFLGQETNARMFIQIEE